MSSIGGHWRPPAAGEGRRRSTSSASLRSDSVRNNPPSIRSPLTNDIILRISPAAGSATLGYVYIAETELRHQDAIIAYFDSPGWEVTVFQCPDFESFIADNNLMYGDVLFISDLPRYIIPAGNRILTANDYKKSPRHDWLPEPPDLSSFGPSSKSRTSHLQRSCSLLSRHSSPVGVRPDPEGFDPQSAPVRHIHMGWKIFASGSYGGMSPLTFWSSGLVGGAASIAVGSRSTGNMGGAPPPLPIDILSISTTATPVTAFVPLAQPDASAAISILGRIVLIFIFTNVQKSDEHTRGGDKHTLLVELPDQNQKGVT